jgi:hypothetical protein
MNRRQFSILLPAVGLVMGCESEPKPEAAATIPINEKVKNAIENLGSVIGDLEEDVEGFQRGDWSKFVPKVEGTAADIRIAYEHLRQALGMPTG